MPHPPGPPAPHRTPGAADRRRRRAALGWAIGRHAGLVLLSVLAAGCHAFGPVDQDVLQEILDLQDRRADGDTLRARVSHPSALVRVWAVRGLGTVGDRGARRLVAAALRHDDDARVRMHAALALLQLGGDEAAFGAALLEDPAASVRSLAALGLASMPQPLVATQPILRLALGDGDGRVRASAAWALARRTQGAVERLALAATLYECILAESDAPTRLSLCTALGQLGAASAQVLGDFAVSKARGPQQREFVLRALQQLWPPGPAPANPALRHTLRRLVRADDVALATAAAGAMARFAPADGERDLDVRALLDAIARGTAAAPAFVDAVAALRPAGRLGLEAAEQLELGAVSGSPRVRASGLTAFARLCGAGALRALQHGLSFGDAMTRAGAARGAASLANTEPDAAELLLRGLLDRSPFVAACMLQGLAEVDPSLHTLASVEPELVGALTRTLRAPPFDGSLRSRLARRALQPEAEPLARALAVRATAILADAEDSGSRALLDAVRTYGDELSLHALADGTALPWSVSLAPRLRTEFDWSWRQRPPRVFVRTTAGTFCVELAPEAAPVHVHHLLGRLADRATQPTMVLARDDGCLRVGRDDIGQVPAPSLLRRAPGPHDPFRIGLVGSVPSGLPDLDGTELFITLEPHPEWLATRTIVGRVVDGMDAVVALHAGDEFLDIRVATRPD